MGLTQYDFEARSENFQILTKHPFNVIYICKLKDLVNCFLEIASCHIFDGKSVLIGCITISKCSLACVLDKMNEESKVCFDLADIYNFFDYTVCKLNRLYYTILYYTYQVNFLIYNPYR